MCVCENGYLVKLLSVLLHLFEHMEAQLGCRPCSPAGLQAVGAEKHAGTRKSAVKDTSHITDRQPESTRRVPGRSQVFTLFVPGLPHPHSPSPLSHEGNDSRDSRRRYTSRLIVFKHNVRCMSTDELECTSVTQFTPASNLRRAQSSRGRSARLMESMLQLIAAMEASGDECMYVCTHARASRCRRRCVHAHRTVLLSRWLNTYSNKPNI